MKKYLTTTYVKYIFAIFYTVLIYVIYQLLNKTWSVAIGAINALEIAGVSLILMGLLAIVGNHGGFDIFGFMFNKKVKEDGHREDFYDFVKRKEEERKKLNFVGLPFISFGLLILIIVFPLSLIIL